MVVIIADCGPPAGLRGLEGQEVRMAIKHPGLLVVAEDAVGETAEISARPSMETVLTLLVRAGRRCEIPHPI